MKPLRTWSIFQALQVTVVSPTKTFNKSKNRDGHLSSPLLISRCWKAVRWKANMSIRCDFCSIRATVSMPGLSCNPNRRRPCFPPFSRPIIKRQSSRNRAKAKPNVRRRTRCKLDLLAADSLARAGRRRGFKYTWRQLDSGETAEGDPGSGSWGRQQVGADY